MNNSTDVPVSIETYVRKRGRPPQPGECAVWGFRLVVPGVTHKDKLIHSKVSQRFDEALAEAQRLAVLRRAVQIVLLAAD